MTQVLLNELESIKARLVKLSNPALVKSGSLKPIRHRTIHESVAASIEGSIQTIDEALDEIREYYGLSEFSEPSLYAQHNTMSHAFQGTKERA